jgi:thiamine-phosphate pyrophosphorylase
MNPALRGLYAITPDRSLAGAALIDAVEACLQGGARILQYRDKGSDPARRHVEAAELRALCARYDALFLVNDDLALAAAVEADGVHLGRDDLDIGSARRRLPAGALIGASCYNRFDLAREAATAGADYVAFGSFNPSPTKPDAVRADAELLRRARRELALPAVAIGGISPENGAALVEAGAAMLAVISALFDAADIRAAAQSFANCFDIFPGDRR